ncbi:amino acid adenylation domain-containing protein [Antrihabitans sp. NCIMB 15449]|uniref:Amino acid adenylation domain-containing protein n=1 Tax=Antrihabitans spumae TaxID=3373370 RepID=A0ABW7JI14_9NOCA
MSDDILERRKQLMQQRLRESGLATAEAAPASKRAAGTPSPLSPAQHRMWFVQKLDPKDTTLNVCVAFRLTGPLDPQRLRDAFATVVARHEILRTTYQVDETGEPYQVSSDEAELSWQQHDLTDLAEDKRTRRLEVLVRRSFARPFELSKDLPLRVSLTRVGADEHVLSIVVHHIGWDDESWPVFFTEVNAAYNGADLPDLVAQYLDVAVDTRTNESADAAALDYWRNVLTPVPERLDLPGSQSGVAAVSKTADKVIAQLPADLMARVAGYGQQHSATPFMVLLAAFDALIYRYTAATDFVVSVPVTTRRGRGSDAVIGYFGNALLVRSDFGRADTFDAVVDSTRAACSAAFAHQSVGIDRVVREVNPARVGGQDGIAQLVQLSFSARGNADGFALSGIESTQLELGSSVAAEPLGLMVVFDQAGGSARVEATYLVDALDEALVTQLLEHYVGFLEAAIAKPHKRIGDIDILGSAGRSDIVAISHGGLVEEPATTLPAMFEDRVAATPDPIALASDDIELSYAELNARANRLAHWLIGQRVGPEDVVALQLATSVEFVIATLAVMKAGGAYLPIDPAYPDDRVEYLVDDALPKLILDVPGLAAAENAAVALSDANPVDADRVGALVPSNIAYVIYTSGSTGKPKGVPVPHNAIAEHLAGFAAEWGLTAADRVLQSTSVSFDASMMDIFVTLTLGARVVVPKPNAFRDLPYVADLVIRHGVTVVHMVPSMLATFLLMPKVKEWQTLRHVPVGGEALPGEVADRFATIFEAELRNHYGPTEAVVASTHMEVEGPQGTGIVPIGIPNRNVYLYLLDDALQLVPTGVVAEIYLGGEQLARGYLGRPGLTAERFVADPFLPGKRLYRTGDLARRNANGDIEFVGRADEQVKIRGYRIELGEVEAAVAAHPGVAHCVVVVAENKTLGTFLAAYAVPVAGLELDTDQVRGYVGAILPEYMVPASIAVIDEIPLTAHGKLDRRALPEPVLSVVREYREPATPTEIRVSALYGTIFNRDQVGADDSFFELGGHSLLAARLVTMIRAEFGLEIDVRVPFDTPTVSGLAGVLVEQFREEYDIDLDELDDEGPDPDIGAEVRASGRPAVGKRERGEHVPLAYSQRAYWFQRKLEGAGQGENVPFGLRFDGPLDRSALITAVGDVVARHESLRTTFLEHEGNPYQFVHPIDEFVVPIVEVDSVEAVDDELANDVKYDFDLSNEPLVRVRLFAVGAAKTDEQIHVLTVLMHHIIADDRSNKIFVEDLTVAYRARLRNETPTAWPTLDIQYADYAMWQREMFDHAPGGGELSPFGRGQIDYWHKALADVPAEITVARDRERPARLGRTGDMVRRTVPASTWTTFKALADEIGATEFMAFQSAAATMMAALGAGEDTTIGAAVANRVGDTTNDLIGLFANVVVLRTDLSGDPTLRTVLRRGRDAALGAISHQDTPFERLVETLNPARSLSRNPLFQVMMHFRYRGQRMDFTEDGSTTIVSKSPDYVVAFMDFHLDFVVEDSGEVTVRVVVNSDIYDIATADVIADTLVGVLDAFAATPDATLSGLAVVPAGWNPNRTPAPRADRVVRPVGDSGAASTSDTERQLIGILEELLEIEDVDGEDGFFALGGDSVISIQWSARAIEAGLPLTPQLVFEHLTITELAAAVDDAIANPPEVEEATEVGDDHRHEPMSASGLSADALAGLQASWSSR